VATQKAAISKQKCSGKGGVKMNKGIKGGLLATAFVVGGVGAAQAMPAPVANANQSSARIATGSFFYGANGGFSSTVANADVDNGILPAPEPSGLLALGAGLLGLTFVVRRKSEALKFFKKGKFKSR
jgi:hypothetical protein